MKRLLLRLASAVCIVLMLTLSCAPAQGATQKACHMCSHCGDMHRLAVPPCCDAQQPVQATQPHDVAPPEAITGQLSFLNQLPAVTAAPPTADSSSALSIQRRPSVLRI